VCAIEPLSLAQEPGHAFAPKCIVALATISKVIVVTLRPNLRVLLSNPLPGRADTLPCLSWHFVTIQTASSGKIVDPVLAYGRQSCIFFYQVRPFS